MSAHCLPIIRWLHTQWLLFQEQVMFGLTPSNSAHRGVTWQLHMAQRKLLLVFIISTHNSEGKIIPLHWFPNKGDILNIWNKLQATPSYKSYLYIYCISGAWYSVSEASVLTLNAHNCDCLFPFLGDFSGMLSWRIDTAHSQQGIDWGKSIEGSDFSMLGNMDIADISNNPAMLHAKHVMQENNQILCLNNNNLPLISLLASE